MSAEKQSTSTGAMIQGWLVANQVRFNVFPTGNIGLFPFEANGTKGDHAKGLIFRLAESGPSIIMNLSDDQLEALRLSLDWLQNRGES